MINIFTKYNPKIGLEVSSHTPKFCLHNIDDPYKKCLKHYSKISESKDEIYLKACPYGFYTFKNNSEIFTSIISSDIKFQNKISKNLKSRGESINDFVILPSSKIKKIIEDTIISTERISVAEDAIHDIRNMMFSVANILERYESYSDVQDIDFKTLLGLSDLMRNRLRIIDDFDSKNGEYVVKHMQYIHPLFHKLKSMMEILCIKKDLSIDLEKNTQYNAYNISEEVFLGIFIIFENAVKHALPKSTIYITFDEFRSVDATYVEIFNESNQIEDDEIDKLINRGYRGKNATAGGTGLGLLKAKKIFENNNIDFSYDVKRNGELRSIFKVNLKFDKNIINK